MRFPKAAAVFLLVLAFASCTTFRTPRNLTDFADIVGENLDRIPNAAPDPKYVITVGKLTPPDWILGKWGVSQYNIEFTTDDVIIPISDGKTVSLKHISQTNADSKIYEVDERSDFYSIQIASYSNKETATVKFKLLASKKIEFILLSDGIIKQSYDLPRMEAP